jgi:sortase (surface protein transpeptidase)
MTFIVAMLLYIFGLKATTGTIQQSTTTEQQQQQQQQQENKNATSTTTFQWLPPSGSTSPEYQS